MTSREPYRPQRIGNLRERVTIQNYVSEPDGYGGTITEWQDVATVPARVEPLKGTERVEAGRLANPYSVNIHIRHRDDVQSDWRISYRGTTFNIISTLNLDERRRFLTLQCEAGA